jgi:hypothetical protein
VSNHKAGVPGVENLVGHGVGDLKHSGVVFILTDDIAKPVMALKTIPTSSLLAHQAGSFGSLSSSRLAIFIHTKDGATGAVLATFDDTIGELVRAGVLKKLDFCPTLVSESVHLSDYISCGIRKSCLPFPESLKGDGECLRLANSIQS